MPLALMVERKEQLAHLNARSGNMLDVRNNKFARFTFYVAASESVANMSIQALIDWNELAVRTKTGRVLIEATMDLVQYELDRYFWILRTGSEASMDILIDWKRFTDAHAADVKANDGTLDPKLIIKLAREELNVWIENENARIADEAKFSEEVNGAIHGVFIGSKKNVMPRKYLIPAVLAKLGYSVESDFEKYEANEERLENHIKTDGEVFAMTKHGVEVNVYRCMDHNGKPTDVTVVGEPLKPSLREDSGSGASSGGDSGGKKRPRYAGEFTKFMSKEQYTAWHETLSANDPTTGEAAYASARAWLKARK